MTRLILATRNAGKITELRAILADAGLNHELVGAEAYPDVPDVKETGVTFAENALLKAHALAQATGLPAVADDSGLCVDVLNGAPGIFSARWAGKHGDDRANLELPASTATTAPTWNCSWPSSATSQTNTAAPTSPARRPWRCRTAGNGWSRASCGGCCGTPRWARTASGTTRSSSRRGSRARARN